MLTYSSLLLLNYADKMPLSAYNEDINIVESCSLAMNRLLSLGGGLVYKESSI